MKRAGGIPFGPGAPSLLPLEINFLSVTALISISAFSYNFVVCKRWPFWATWGVFVTAACWLKWVSKKDSQELLVIYDVIPPCFGFKNVFSVDQNRALLLPLES